MAIAEIGQGGSLTDFTDVSTNGGSPQPSASTFEYPYVAAVAGTDLFVVDTYNSRVLVFKTAGKAASASVVLGQSDFPLNNPNGIQNREFYFASSSEADAGIAIDSSGSTTHLYVADPNNNRVLGFNDARTVGAGVAADIVIGQPLQANGSPGLTTLCNFAPDAVVNPTNDTLPRQPTAETLCYPTGLAVNPATGDLFVADSSNGRVLRFPAPFDPSHVSSVQHADLVLGQAAFTGVSNPQASQSVMEVPYGLVFDSAQGLFVSDAQANRVLLFPIASGTQSGEAATEVIGQSTFVVDVSTALNSPRHIGEDSIGRIYVADYGNNRVAVFSPSGQVTPQAIGYFTSLQGGSRSLSGPQAVWVNSNKLAGTADDIWVGDTNGISRYISPSLTGGTGQATLTMPAGEWVAPKQSANCSSQTLNCAYPVAALALTQDAFGNLYAADASNRVAIHYAALTAKNSASYVCYMGCTLGAESDPCVIPSSGAGVSCGLAPGAFATLYPLNSGFTDTTTYANGLPLPATLAGIQVLINGVAAPLSVITPPNPMIITNGREYLGQINLIVPWEAPTSGTAQLVVWEPSTSQILGTGTLSMADFSPAFFTNNGGGTGQIAALNCNTVTNGSCDNTRNGTTSPVNAGGAIQLFLTGQGPNLSGAIPPDGQAPTGLVQTAAQPLVYIGGTTTPATILYSGLAPGFPGLWQLNVQIPSKLTNLAGFDTGIFPVQVYFNGVLTKLPSDNGNPNAAATIAINAPE